MMVRIMLVLLVAVNLTLVCLGHDRDGRRTVMHITLLGEPRHISATHGEQKHENVREMRDRHEKSNAEDDHVAAEQSSEAFSGAADGPALAESHSHGHGFTMLGLALIGLFMGAKRPSRSMLAALRPGIRSQTSIHPLDPPPRSSVM